MSAEQAVDRTMREYTAACNAGDAEAFMATLASDVVFCPPGQPTVRGRDAVGAWAKEGFFDPFQVTLAFETERFVEAGGEIFVPGTFKLDLKPKEGGETQST